MSWLLYEKCKKKVQKIFNYDCNVDWHDGGGGGGGAQMLERCKRKGGGGGGGGQKSIGRCQNIFEQPHYETMHGDFHAFRKEKKTF